MSSPADEARKQGRPILLAITHDFHGGWCPVEKRGPNRLRPDPLRCRVCGRLEGHPTHGSIG